jgi:hypothetical protein
MIQPSLERYGLTQIQWHDRDDALPAGVTPKSDPKYRDDWDSWVSAVYTGATKAIDIPHYDHVDWLLNKPSATNPAAAKPPPDATASNLSAGTVIVVVAVLWAVSRRR